jgi:chaperonin cofactor prefoldin
MRKHYRAAKSLKDTSVNRKKIVGDFLVAVEKEVVENEEDAIEEFLEAFSG